MPRENMFSVKVDNLNYDLDKHVLRDLFSKFGEIGDVYIPQDPRSREPREYGFVRFVDERDAEDAVKEMDGYRPKESRNGDALKVVMAEIGKGQGRGGRGRGGYRGGGRNRSRSGGRYRSRSNRGRRDSRDRGRDRDYDRDRRRDDSRDRGRDRDRRRDDSHDNRRDRDDERRRDDDDDRRRD